MATVWESDPVVVPKNPPDGSAATVPPTHGDRVPVSKSPLVMRFWENADETKAQDPRSAKRVCFIGGSLENLLALANPTSSIWNLQDFTIPAESTPEGKQDR